MRVGQSAYVYPQTAITQAATPQEGYEIAVAELEAIAHPGVQVQNQQFLDTWNRVGQGLDAGGSWAWDGAHQVGGAIGHGAVEVGGALGSGAKTVGGALWHGVTAVGGALAKGAGALVHGTGSLLAGAWHGLSGLFKPQPSPWQPIPGLPVAPGQPLPPGQYLPPGAYTPAPGQPGSAYPSPYYPYPYYPLPPVAYPPVPPPPPAPPAPVPPPPPAPPAPKPPAAQKPKPKPKPSKPKAPKPKPTSGKAKLEKMSRAQLAHLGATDKKAFFAALRPAAEEAQRKYGVPAAITLAQAALETGWGQHLAADYNLFGIKGKGPAGSHTVRTREVYHGKSVYVNAAFASYHNFYEAVEAHGKLFHNGYYNKALSNYQKNHSVAGFAKDITGVYATDPSYGSKLMQLIHQYKL